jgi:sigma-E factor negative regulatory protein RseC
MLSEADRQVEHEGIVASVLGNTMIVRIIASSACTGCAARSSCKPSESKDKDIRVEGFSGDFVSGERVKVIMQQSLGIKALCIGYLIPFVVVLATLLVVFQTTKNELASGLSALLVLVPYYLIIKLLNRKITKSFGFTVQKINVA